MTLSPSSASVRPQPQPAMQAPPADAHAALAVRPTATALGFPQAGEQAQTAGTQPTLALSHTEAVLTHSAGGFERLPVVLVVQIVVPYLGIPGLSAMKGLAAHYPGFRDAIGDAVDADPLFQSLGKLLQPMRIIVTPQLQSQLVRDIHDATPKSNDIATMSASEREHLRRLVDIGNACKRTVPQKYTLARHELSSSVWLPLVEQLVQQQVNGVLPEHVALLGLCDRILAGHMPSDRERDDAIGCADAIGFDETLCRRLMEVAQLDPADDEAMGHAQAMADYRKSVLGDAFRKIAMAFAAEAGWTIEGLMAESARLRPHELN